MSNSANHHRFGAHGLIIAVPASLVLWAILLAPVL
jgi:hypothetical protein